MVKALDHRQVNVIGALVQKKTAEVLSKSEDMEDRQMGLTFTRLKDEES